ncbi:MAG: toll/interleukin-1 receptor domain-containing protein, partial [Pseudonocardiaceae bacterium]
MGTSGYDAFISYSHVLDGALARALQTGMEQFAKPWYRPRALRVFRDTTNLAADPDLWRSIETALASSSWLVLMASPEAARSPWVNREVAWWQENKSPQRLLVVLTKGHFAWDDPGDGASEALPPALRGAFAQEPRWVDLRWLHDVDQIDQSNPQLRECVADVAAAVREVPKDELVGEHIRQHRRTMRLARGGVTALTVLLIAALVAAVVAVGQRNQAVAAQHTAVARGMVAQAEGIRDRNPRVALRFGVAANQLDPSPLTQASLMQTLMSSRYRSTLDHTDVVLAVAFSPDGHTLATGSFDQTALLWDLTDRAQPRRIGQPLTGVTGGAVAFSPDGHTFATHSDDGTVLWDVSDRAQPRRLGRPLTNTVGSMAFSPDGRILAVGGRDSTVVLWDLTDRAQPRRLGQPLTGYTFMVNAVAFSPDGRTLATGTGDQTILWDLTDLAQPRR